MRWSQFFLPTLREAPKDAEAVSHILMLRAGLIRRLGSGAYSYLPFGLRALQKAEAIVREEMNRAGAQEVLLPALQPIELWKQTGRDRVLGDVLIRFKDRTGKEMALGPTHEEVITDVVKEINSYKQLPVMLYQIQTKFRDEPRPRAGVIRSKEFLMKDAYSFDVDAHGLEASYQRMYDAYARMFKRCGLTVIPCEADPGMMGGEASCEFMAPSENGEDRVVRCAACGYAANLEAAQCAPSVVSATTHGGSAKHVGGESPPSIEKAQPLEPVQTPGKHTVEQVSQFLKVSPRRLIKTLLYDVENDHVAVLVRGDHEVNDAKLSRALGTTQLKLSNAKTVEQLSAAPLGFAGPVKLAGIRLVADHAAMEVVNAVTGANLAETHFIHVNPGRDFQPSLVADLRVATEEDRCPTCGEAIACVKAIEAGHVFKLGTKYTKALGAMFQDRQGKQQPMIMGCYGIGINRILATAIEQRHDAAGIIWHPALAPFQVLVSMLEADHHAAQQAAEQMATALEQAGLEVLLDDRAQSPGSKLKDADLIGLPVQVIVGKVWQAQGQVEVVERASKVKHQVPPSALVAAVQALLDKLMMA